MLPQEKPKPTNDLTEFRDLVSAIKADRQTQREKEIRDSWTKYVSLSMIFIAVLSAISGQKGGGYSSTVMKKLNEATFNQAAASDQWSLYQAKGIKQSIAEGGLDALKLNPDADKRRLDDLAAKVKRYDGEKQEVMKEAQGLEAKRDEARKTAEHAASLSQGMGLASTLFQIAIALGGVCLIVKKRWLWWASLTLGAVATLQMASVLMRA